MPRRAKPPRPYRVPITRYVDADGKRCTKTSPGAVKQTTESDKYYADLPGSPRTPLGTSNEAEAWRVLDAKLREARDRQIGIVDEYAEHARTELAAHLVEFCAILTAKGTTEEQINLVKGRLERLAALASWTRLPQITGDSAMLALAKVQAPESQGGLGKSAATRNYYLTHLKSFVTWAVDGGRMRGNPVRGLKPINVETDRRHLRRVPSAEEVAELCRWLQTDGVPYRRCLAPRERRLGYLLSMATGYRAGELRSLKEESFDLTKGSVVVAAGYSKRRRRDTQQLPPWLVEELQAWFGAENGWHWNRLDKQSPGKILKADLRDCRVDWIADAPDDEERKRREASSFLLWRVETPDGRRFWDYHSFRHTYCTFMGNLPGISLKTLLSLTRHSSAELALKTYARGEEQRIREAVDQLPPPLPPAE